MYVVQIIPQCYLCSMYKLIANLPSKLYISSSSKKVSFVCFSLFILVFRSLFNQLFLFGHWNRRFSTFAFFFLWKYENTSQKGGYFIKTAEICQYYPDDPICPVFIVLGILWFTYELAQHYRSYHETLLIFITFWNQIHYG